MSEQLTDLPVAVGNTNGNARHMKYQAWIVNEIQIDAEFKALCPPLTDTEHGQLEENILHEGCRDALIVWREEQILLDGHNRYGICTEHGLDFDWDSMSFDTRDDAKLWISKNQTGRRNLSPQQMSYQRGLQYRLEKKGRGGDRKSNHQNDGLIEDTAERLAEEHNVGKATIERDAKFSDAVDSFEPEERQDVLSGDYTKKAIVAADGDMHKLDRLQRTADEAIDREIDFGLFAPSVPHVAHSTGDNEWYTPAEIIEAARETMGSIDLDPASSAQANEVVQAADFYTSEMDGLSLPWTGNVWMNPPYAQPLIAQFTEKLRWETESGNVLQFCCLVNNATETKFFSTIATCASLICFPTGRIPHFNPSHPEKASVPLQGSAILYYGERTCEFWRQFSVMGLVVKPQMGVDQCNAL